MLLRFRVFPQVARAGFPSPGDSHFERPLDLNNLVAFDADATYFVMVEGDSMRGANIASGDILIVSRALEATSQSIVVVVLDGQFLVKRIVSAQDGSISLHSAHLSYPPIQVNETMHFSVWGVVVFVLHPLHPLAVHRLHPPSERT